MSQTEKRRSPRHGQRGGRRYQNQQQFMPPMLGIEIKNEQSAEECICERPEATIHCNSCGSMHRGRLPLVCPAHRNVFFLMDIAKCPNCGSGKDSMIETKIDYDLAKIHMERMRIQKENKTK